MAPQQDNPGPFPCRLLLDLPQDGAWNMAVDEALLKDAAAFGIATLRFYEWSEPTLSLGYFQKYVDRAEHFPSAEAVCVRRQSGGGAIMHDRELTYSLTLPKAHPLSGDAQTLYMTVHEILTAALRRRLPTSASRTQLGTYDADTKGTRGAEPFLCFLRRSRGDIVFSQENPLGATVSYKIVGSAQRRSRGAVLLHGSILLGRSAKAPELAGLDDLCDNNFDTTCLKSELSTQILDSLKLSTTSRALSDQIFAVASALRDEKYRSRFWTQKS
jgi:lipoate-protein ligase A